MGQGRPEHPSGSRILIHGCDNILTWYTDPNIQEEVLRFAQRAQEIMRSDTEENAFVAYTNTSRDDPIGYRYKDAEAVDALRAMKRRWDPEGCFTKELL
ncbi:MAG: hypothetical protein Q9188_003716 [Gyalolechia gomerana]